MGTKFETLKRRLTSELETAMAEFEKNLDGRFSDSCWSTGTCPAHDDKVCVEQIVSGDKVLPGILIGAMEYGPGTLLHKMVTEVAQEWCDEQECCCFKESQAGEADRIAALECDEYTRWSERNIGESKS